MRCGDIMRRPVEVARQGETIQDAARRMRDANIGFLPVVGDGDRVIGVITDRDLVVRGCARGLVPDRSAVEELVSHELVACRPQDDLHYVARLMALHRVSRVLVVEGDRPVGVVSLSDLAAHLDGAAETLRRVAVREIVDESGHRISPRP